MIDAKSEAVKMPKLWMANPTAGTQTQRVMSVPPKDYMLLVEPDMYFLLLQNMCIHPALKIQCIMIHIKYLYIYMIYIMWIHVCDMFTNMGIEIMTY